MSICFVGKYPLIEGGVRASTYWLARGARSRLDEAAGHLAVVDYVLRADASHDETAKALRDIFAQIELCTGRAVEQAQEISRQLPSHRDLRQTLS